MNRDVNGGSSKLYLIRNASNSPATGVCVCVGDVTPFICERPYLNISNLTELFCAVS